jgi:Sec-independent protein translocase protein TatA
MDSIFGIGVPELVIILLLAGVIMGPQRIRQVAYTLGRITAQLQKVSREFTRQLNAELDSLEDGSIRDTMSDVRQLQKEVAELRRELARAPKSLQEAGHKLTEETEKAFRDAAAVADEAQKEVAQEAAAQEATAQEAPAESSPPKPQLPNPIDVPGDPD